MASSFMWRHPFTDGNGGGMKSTRTYAMQIAAAVLLLVALILIVNEIFDVDHSWIYYLVFGAVLAASIFLVVRYFFIRFVESKIDPIYKNIHNFTMPAKSVRAKISNGDVIEDTNREVKIWAHNQKEEIKKLKKLEKYQKDFLGNVSHELKTPIFNIQGYILTLLEGGIDDSTINTLYLKRAERSINRMINIVEDLDSIARLESGEFTLKMEDFNLLKLFEEVIEYLEMPASRQNIKIGFDKTYNKALMVRADRKSIIEVAGNLISNAVKYGKEGGKVSIGFTDTGKQILVDISDNGIGIAEKNLPRIFERFYRVDKSRSRESGGTGLGLAIVKHTLQAHKQTITVRSKEYEGSTFIFSLDKA